MKCAKVLITCEFEMIFVLSEMTESNDSPERVQTPVQFPANSMSFNPKIWSD